MNLRKQTKTTLLAIILTAILMTIAFGAILYTISKDSHWGVQTDLGLQLYESGSPISSVEWGEIPRYGTGVKDLTLVNLSNKGVNVTQIMPSNTSTYGFSTSFIPGYWIPKEANYTFSVTLEDLNMVAGTIYSGQFNYSIVE